MTSLHMSSDRPFFPIPPAIRIRGIYGTRQEVVGGVAGSDTFADMASGWKCAITQLGDVSRSLVPFGQDRSLVAVQFSCVRLRLKPRSLD